MKHQALILAMVIGLFGVVVANAQENGISQHGNKHSHQQRVQQARRMQQKENTKNHRKQPAPVVQRQGQKKGKTFHSSTVSVHAFMGDPDSVEFYPTALVAENRVVTFIAGTPVISSPYLGARPAFDGSDYIINISSINRDIRLMQQRRRLYEAYQDIGYPVPDSPIIAISGKVEPLGWIDSPYVGKTTGDITVGSNELDVAAILNADVEAFMGIVYDQFAWRFNSQRYSNSLLTLNMGFVNIGNLDRSPLYMTAGQLYVPFGRFSTSMVSAPLTMRLARTRARMFILGYKSQVEVGPFAAIYGFKSDTTLGTSGVGGINLGYVYNIYDASGEVGVSILSSIDDATGMQYTGSPPGTTFAGFASRTNGSENVAKVPAAGVHANMGYDRYTFTAEWVGTINRFRTEDLSYNGHGARPQALQLEGGWTFMLCDLPSSISLGYQWSQDALALNIPKQRIAGVFNISIWKDTVESLEYRHDIDYKTTQYGNGAAPPGTVNATTVGTGRSADTLLLQLGIFF